MTGILESNTFFQLIYFHKYYSEVYRLYRDQAVNVDHPLPLVGHMLL